MVLPYINMKGIILKPTTNIHFNGKKKNTLETFPKLKIQSSQLLLPLSIVLKNAANTLGKS